MKVQEKNKKSESKITPCFIIGMGRSGTTLLTSLLNANSQLIAAPENNFILFGYPLLKVSNQKELIENFKKIFTIKHNHTLSVWSPNLSLDKNIEYSYQDLCRLAYLDYDKSIDRNEIKYFVDKNPIYSLYINKLITVFPDAKFIILSRDYRDNILSRSKYTRGLISNMMVSLASSWRLYYKNILKFEKKCPKQFIRVRYEDISSNPKSELQRICDFLEIEFTESMILGREKNIHKLISKSDMDIGYKQKIEDMHGRLKESINTDRVGYWNGEFSNEQLAVQEIICGNLGESFGYEKSLRLNLRLKFLTYLKIMMVYPFFWLSIKVFFGMYYNLPLWVKFKIFKK